MKAIILAAGRGSRMNSRTDDHPKCLVELRGKTLLEWQLTALTEADIDQIAIVTGYMREQLADRASREFHNPRWAETNMVTSLACAQEWLQTDACIVSYSDIFYDASAVKSLINSTADLGVTYDPNWLDIWQARFGDPLVDAETFRLNADGTLCEIGNRPETLDEVEGQYMGLLRFSPQGWAEVMRIRAGLTDTERDRMHMTGTLQKVIEAGNIPVMAIAYNDEWGEVDTISDLDAYK